MTNSKDWVDSIQAYKEFDNHEMVVFVSDEASGLSGFITIHSTKLGPTLGGTRFQVYDSEDAALRDALNLSRAMSYKCALANLPYGGAKGVIVANGVNNNRADVLHAYARNVENLRGIFKTGTDVGIQDSDVAEMGKYTSHMLGLKEGDREGMSTGKTAGLGAYYAVRAVFSQKFGSPDVKGRSVAVKGVGKLGSELVRLLYEEGAKVFIADIDSGKCDFLKSKYPEVKIVAPGEIHKQAVDVYSPCALGNEFTIETLEEIQTTAIAGGANNQLFDEGIGDKLFEKGILYAPDFVANAGGLIYVADELEPGGFNRDRVFERTRGIEATLKEIFKVSAEQNRSTSRVANEIAEQRMSIGIRKET